MRFAASFFDELTDFGRHTIGYRAESAAWSAKIKRNIQ
jgi:hypothetical protein